MILKKHITARFIAMIFIILLIGQSLGAFILLLHTREALFDSLHTRIERTAQMAAGVSAEPLLRNDYSHINTYLEEIISDEDILSIHIRDNNKKIINEKIKSKDADIHSVNPFLFKQDMKKNEPVKVAGQMLGEVTIRYSAKTINESLSRSSTVILLYQGIMFLSVGVVIVFLFNRNIKRPLSAINKSIEKISTGDLVTEVPELGQDEIGHIARGVTVLAERLSVIVSKLHSTAVDVSMAIKQVDIMHKNIIDGISQQSDSVKDSIESIRNANKSQSEIIINTEKLASFSTENVSSLLEMKATAEDIALNTQRLYKATEDSYAVVELMNRSATASSNDAELMVSAVEDTSASVEEIGASIKEVEDHAKDSSKLAERVKEIISNTGMLAVVNAVEGMDKISDEVINSSEIIQRLDTRSMDIEKVLSVIKDVTEQTNLLSLNAAILAAQAGEYGKSFSVVADEISALSDRTAASTREIAGIVKTIQKDIKDARHSIDNAKIKVNEGNSLVIKVGDTLKETLTASEHSTDMTKAIQRATEEQSFGLIQITSAIEEIRKMTGNVVSSAKKQEESLAQLLDGVGEVKEVADISKRSTEEQATSTRFISKNLELANERIAQINQAGVHQKGLNDEIIAAMVTINNLGMATVRDMNDVSKSLSTLSKEIEILKKEMEVFKTGK